MKLANQCHSCDSKLGLAGQVYCRLYLAACSVWWMLIASISIMVFCKGNLGGCRYRFPGQFHIHLLNHGNNWGAPSLPVWPDRADSGECEGAAHYIYINLISQLSVLLACITNCLHATFSDNKMIAFGYITCSGFSWDFTCGLMSIYTHPFITLRLFNEFGRYGCDWALLTLFSCYFCIISFY